MSQKFKDKLNNKAREDRRSVPNYIEFTLLQIWEKEPPIVYTRPPAWLKPALSMRQGYAIHDIEIKHEKLEEIFKQKQCLKHLQKLHRILTKRLKKSTADGH